MSAYCVTCLQVLARQRIAKAFPTPACQCSMAPRKAGVCSPGCAVGAVLCLRSSWALLSGTGSDTIRKSSRRIPSASMARPTYQSENVQNSWRKRIIPTDSDSEDQPYSSSWKKISGQHTARLLHFLALVIMADVVTQDHELFRY